VALRRQVPEAGLEILAVSADQTREALARVQADGLQLSLDEQEGEAGGVGVTARRYGTEKLPETYLVDRSGAVRAHFVGDRNWASPEAARCLRELLREGR
jgi:hypothetical protein